MKKLYFTSFYLLLVIHVFAQSQKPPLVEVRGNASMQVPPDLAVITISFNSLDMAFNKAVKSVNDKNASLLKQLEKLGFKKTEIKSNSFNAGKNIFYRDHEPVDSGYIASQSVILEFKYDQQRVTKLVDAFIETTLELNFQFSFILSEEKLAEVRGKLIELSIQNAHERAAIIARQSKLTLGSIQHIQYGFSEDYTLYQRLQYRVPPPLSAANDSGGFNDLTVQDIAVSDEVLISWLISNKP
jgi:uncharacterized protein YggE